MRITLTRFTVLMMIFMALYALNVISKSTHVQFFGGLINRIDTNEKIIALTFDDGPNPPYTNQMLDILDRYQVKATFFVIGEEVEKHPDVIYLSMSKGHELGNHSYSRSLLIYENPSFIRSEIEKTDQLLRHLGVVQDIQFRPPDGRKLFVLPYLLSTMNRPTIMWNVFPDPPDTVSSNTPQTIADYVVDHVQPGSIIRLHDGDGDRSKTVIATGILIRSLKEKGYTFLTVSDFITKNIPK